MGHAPVLRLSRVAERRIAVAAEWWSPAGSARDEVAAEWFRLHGGAHSSLVVASRGNLAISLSWLAASRGLPVTAVVPDHASLERRALLRAYGASVELVPAESGDEGLLERAKAIAAAKTGAHLLHDASSDLPWADAARRAVARISSAAETVGSAPAVIVSAEGSEPAAAAWCEEVRRVFPTARALNVVPERRVSRLQELSPTDSPLESVPVSDVDARQMQIRLGREEGLLVGNSTGAAVAAAAALVASLPSGAWVHVTSPDNGERDFSVEELFA